MIQAYSIAIGIDYVILSYHSLAITRHFNPYLPITLYYFCEDDSPYITKLKQELDITCIRLPSDFSFDRWDINFLKWEVELLDSDFYLYFDIDAFLVGTLTRPIVEGICVKNSVNFALHPKYEKIKRIDPIWTNNEPAAYYIPREERSHYYNAGIGLFTKQGMEEFRVEIKKLKDSDKLSRWYRTSPYYDENYVNKVLRSFSFGTLGPEWNLFHSLAFEIPFFICHFANWGSSFHRMFESLSYCRKLYKVKQETYETRFFPVDYFQTGWLMETMDRFVLLGVLSSLQVERILWVGVYAGKDLEVIRRRHPQVSIEAIDISAKHLSENAMEGGWIKFHLGDSKETIPKVTQTFKPDLIYIDGDHSYEAVLADLKCSFEYKEAIIMGHDWHHPPVQAAVTEMARLNPEWHLKVLETPITHIFDSTYGGFFLFLPPFKNSESL